MIEAEAGITRLQAAFRGKRSREVHVARVRQGLPWSPFVPAKEEAVAKILQVASIQAGDVVVDIGSGDGRVVIQAAVQYPSIEQAIGIEIDSTLVATSQRKIHEHQLQDKVSIIHDDWMNVKELERATIVILFFLPHSDMAAMLQQRLRSGTRVISYVFQIDGWTPEQDVETVPFMNTQGSSPIYLYRVPQLK